RGGVAPAQEPFELRSRDGNERAARVALDHPPQKRPRARGPVVGAVERPCLAEAPGHLRLPRDDAQRFRIRADREVDVPLLAADDGGVTEVRAHDHRAEGDALLEHLEEVADRDVLAARDAVEVRVEQPDRLHALAPQGRHGGFRVVTDGHRALCLLFGTHPRTRTGIRLTPLTKHERSRTGSPARSTLGRYGIISSSQTLISSFARCIPRQKCGPPRPKVRWRFGVLPTSSRYGSANLASS